MLPAVAVNVALRTMLVMAPKTRASEKASVAFEIILSGHVKEDGRQNQLTWSHRKSQKLNQQPAWD